MWVYEGVGGGRRYEYDRWICAWTAGSKVQHKVSTVFPDQVQNRIDFIFSFPGEGRLKAYDDNYQERRGRDLYIRTHYKHNIPNYAFIRSMSILILPNFKNSSLIRHGIYIIKIKIHNPHQLYSHSLSQCHSLSTHSQECRYCTTTVAYNVFPA